MKTVRLTVAEALAQYLAAQMIEIDGKKEQLFGAAFAIFGHGNADVLWTAAKKYRRQNSDLAWSK